MSSYLRELARVLVPGGVAFLHHSNLGAFLDPKTGKPAVSAEHWRGRTVTAEGVRRLRVHRTAPPLQGTGARPLGAGWN